MIASSAAPTYAARPNPTAARESAVVCVGLSHQTAPLDIRERVALPAETRSAALARFGCGRPDRPAGVSELVILATCNRLELFAAGGDAAEDILLSLLADTTGVSEDELRGVVFSLAGEDAVRHLFRTAAGLESMVVGEPQILGQVSDAYSTALAHGSAGHVMSSLFRGAIRAGRRARAETAINRNPATVSSVAVKLVSDTLPALDRAAVLVIGAGEMAELAVSALHHRGVRRIAVASRTREHAERLSQRFGGESVAFERLADALSSADVVITSTAAPHHVITRHMVAGAMDRRPERTLVMVDIAVPRDVDPACSELPNVTVLDLEDLQRSIAESLSERELEIPRVEEIVAEEATVCIDGLRQLDVLPLIADLRTHTDAVRRAALEKARRQFAHLPPADRERIAAFSESLVNRLFHEPIVRLRQEARDGQVAGYAMAVRHLFGLE